LLVILFRVLVGLVRLLTKATRGLSPMNIIRELFTR